MFTTAAEGDILEQHHVLIAFNFTEGLGQQIVGVNVVATGPLVICLDDAQVFL